MPLSASQRYAARRSAAVRVSALQRSRWRVAMIQRRGHRTKHQGAPSWPGRADRRQDRRIEAGGGEEPSAPSCFPQRKRRQGRSRGEGEEGRRPQRSMKTTSCNALHSLGEEGGRTKPRPYLGEGEGKAEENQEPSAPPHFGARQGEGEEPSPVGAGGGGKAHAPAGAQAPRRPLRGAGLGGPGARRRTSEAPADCSAGALGGPGWS